MSGSRQVSLGFNPKSSLKGKGKPGASQGVAQGVNQKVAQGLA